MTQTKSLKRRFGSTATEVTKFDPRLVSIRLQDGTYLGPEIVVYEDGNYGIAPGHLPLEYTPEVLEILQQDAWNTRRVYRNMEDLCAKITAFGGFNPDQPTRLLLSGNRLFLVEGHRRHYAWWLLQQEGYKYADFYGIIRAMQSVGSIRDVEYLMLSTDDGKDAYTISEQAQLIDRQRREDLANGMSADDFKAEFLKRTGWSASRFDNTLLIMQLPRDVIAKIDAGLISQSAVGVVLRDQALNTDEAANLLRAAATESQAAGKNSVTVSYVREVVSGYKEQKESQAPTSEAASPVNEQGLKVKPPKPKASEINALFRELMNNAEAVSQGEITSLGVKSDLWERMLDAFNRMV